jgi:hypothetical protein
MRVRFPSPAPTRNPQLSQIPATGPGSRSFALAACPLRARCRSARPLSRRRMGCPHRSGNGVVPVPRSVLIDHGCTRAGAPHPLHQLTQARARRRRHRAAGLAQAMQMQTVDPDIVRLRDGRPPAHRAHLRRAGQRGRRPRPRTRSDLPQRPVESAQYTSAAFAELASDFHVDLSHGRTGQCWDCESVSRRVRRKPQDQEGSVAESSAPVRRSGQRYRCHGSGWLGPRPRLIVSTVTFLADLVVEGLLRWPVERLRRRTAERRMSRGRLDCAFKVVSGSQGGLSRRWRHVRATVSPGQLDARGHWWRLFRALPTVSIVAVRGPARLPASAENWSLAASCRIVELQTPTAILSWAVIGDYLPAALAQLRARSEDNTGA